MQKEIRVLIVDDAEDTLEMLERKLKAHSYKTITANNVSKAIEIINSMELDLVLTDYKMPQISGIDLIRYIREHKAEIKVIMITGYPSIEGAVEAVKVGAEEYLSKPFTDTELFNALEKVVKIINTNKKKKQEDNNSFGLLAYSKEMQIALNQLKSYSMNNKIVYIQGEDGTGKELIAKCLHYHSERAKAPFVHVNLGSIPENFLDIELFGCSKSYNPDFKEEKQGLFSMANGGTIYLHGISEVSLSVQIKILRIIEEKQMFMLGSRKALDLDIRIIASSDKDLQFLVKQGLFREDLYYHLSTQSLTLPALRMRQEDIIPLFYHFINQISKEYALYVPKVNENIYPILKAYYWPANISELEKLVYNLLINNPDNVIDINALPDYLKFNIPCYKDLSKSLQEIEQEYIHDVILSVHGNKSKAAKILKIDRKTLHNRLNQDQEL